MQSSAAQQGEERASRMQTRLQAKLAGQREKERDEQTHGLCQSEYWAKYVRSEVDIIRFYQLYHADYPEMLVKSIAMRVSAIVEKSRRGEELTDEEKGYWHRSQQPSQSWDPKEDLKTHELAGKINIAMQHMAQLDVAK